MIMDEMDTFLMQLKKLYECIAVHVCNKIIKLKTFARKKLRRTRSYFYMTKGCDFTPILSEICTALCAVPSDFVLCSTHR